MSSQKQRRVLWQKEYEAAQVVVLERSKGWCEVEGCDHVAEIFHHKKGRRAKDSNDPTMILHACNECHLHIHQYPAFSYANGYMVSRTS